MRILTVLGTRPEIIRLSCIIPKLDALCDHRVIYTGQNWDPCLKDIFFKDLNLRAPDAELICETSKFGTQLGKMLDFMDEQLTIFKPDKVLILGDTNSSLMAIAAKRHLVPVYHMEAGNRCFDARVPEETNRKIIDHISDVLLPYTQNSKQFLIAEGIHPRNIYVTGNPIYEVMQRFSGSNEYPESPYFLATIHRAENTNDQERFDEIMGWLSKVALYYGYPVKLSLHPRIREKFKARKGIIPFEPCAFREFINLQKYAKCVLTDSGTVQEECSIMDTPTVTLRKTTERPETIECGSNIICYDGEQVIKLVGKIMSQRAWVPPSEYLVKNVSDIVTNILLGN